MDCNTAIAGVSAGAVAFDLSSVWRRLGSLTDRRHAHGKRYPLALLVLFMILAKLSGEDRPSGMADWVKHRLEQLQTTLGLELKRAPHHNTYRRILAQVLEPGELDRLVGGLLLEQGQAGRSVLISIDGKTVRGTIGLEEPQGTHLLVAYLPEEGVVLLQVPTGGKTNEIGVAPRLLAGLDLRDKIVAADALHTQREFAAKVVQAGGEYVLMAKDNQPSLHDDIEHLFSGNDRSVEGGEFHHDFESAKQTDKGHGRKERRQITVSSELAGYSDWPHLEQVFKLERERFETSSGKYEHEIVYGLTSLTKEQAAASRLLELTRAYWGVENGLHYRRDVTFQEDATRLTKGNAGHVMASLNNLVIGLLRLAGFTNLAAARRFCAASLANALAILSPLPPT